MMSASVIGTGLPEDLKIKNNNNDVLKRYLLEHSSVFSKLCDLKAQVREFLSSTPFELIDIRDGQNQKVTSISKIEEIERIALLRRYAKASLR